MAWQRLLARLFPSKDEQLLAAAEKGHLSRVKKLIARGANVNARDKQGWTPLLKAGRHPEVVKALLAAGAKVDARVHRQTMLHLLTQYSGSLEVLSILLSAGADPNARGASEAELPLALACERGRLDMVLALLKAGADPNAGWEVKNNQWSAALECALMGGHTYIVKLLIKAGANPYRVHGGKLAIAAGSEHIEALQAWIRAAPKLKDQLVEGKGPAYTAMHSAVTHRDRKAIKVLLKLGLYPCWKLGDALKFAKEIGDQDLAAEIQQAMTK